MDMIGHDTDHGTDARHQEIQYEHESYREPRFQESVVDVLVTKTVDAAQRFGAAEILLAGGVAANSRLREELARRASVPVRYPPLSLCTDNAAMVAAAAFYRFAAGVQSGWELDVVPGLKLGD